MHVHDPTPKCQRPGNCMTLHCRIARNRARLQALGVEVAAQELAVVRCVSYLSKRFMCACSNGAPCSLLHPVLNCSRACAPNMDTVAGARTLDGCNIPCVTLSCKRSVTTARSCREQEKIAVKPKPKKKQAAVKHPVLPERRSKRLRSGSLLSKRMSTANLTAMHFDIEISISRQDR
jgi:hypothetical protein